MCSSDLADVDRSKRLVGRIDPMMPIRKQQQLVTDGGIFQADAAGEAGLGRCLSAHDALLAEFSIGQGKQWQELRVVEAGQLECGHVASLRIVERQAYPCGIGGSIRILP